MAAPALSNGGRPLKIDIVVHGRFHGFALARALIAQGHDVLLHTNYPKAIVEKFGVSRRNVRSFVVHGIASRALQRLDFAMSRNFRDRWLHTTFGAWAARSIRPDSDFVHGFSGVMEEFLATPRGAPHQVRTLVRGSAHIREQARLLLEEEQRAGVALDRPSDWMIAREEREYASVDKICVLSTFARDSFVARRVGADRLWTTPLGVDIRQFGVAREELEARVKRIRSGAPLRVLNVGTLSFQKGCLDLLAVAQRLSHQFEFRFVGAISPEAKDLAQQARNTIEIFGRVPEGELPVHYAWADIFLYPTIQDGFAAVLLQAAAAGLPIIGTTNCSAPDIVAEGKTGWIVDIRDLDRIFDKLNWCDRNREPLIEMALEASQADHARSWDFMARQMVSLWYGEGLEKSVTTTP